MKWAAALVILAACADDDPWVGTFSGTLTEQGTARAAVVSIERCNASYLAAAWPIDVTGDVIIQLTVGMAGVAAPVSLDPITGRFELTGDQLTATLDLQDQAFRGIRNSTTPFAVRGCGSRID